MRTLALGLFAAAGIALAIPANAQGVYVGAGPNGVGVGVGVVDHHDRDWHRRHDHITVGVGHRDCKTVIIHEHGMTKKIRRCR